MHAALGIATGRNAADFFDMAAGDGDSAAAAEGAPPASASGTDEPEAMDTAEIRAPRWMEPKRGGEPDPASTTGAQPPRWKKYRAEDESDGQAQAPREADKGDAGDSGGPAPPTPQAEPQQDEFEPRRKQVISQAQFDGIDVPAEYLRQLCPEALGEWAREHLL